MCCYKMKLALVAVIMAVMTSDVVASVRSTQRRPNILLLLTDDQDLLLGGADHMKFLDKHLRQQGSTFHNYFVHTPTCCPSRSSILSGRYLHNIGVVNNSIQGNCDGPAWQNEVENYTFAVYAQQAGYRTGYAGKYLNTYGRNGTNRVPAGWDKWLAIVGNSQYYNYNVVKSDDGGENSTRHRHGRNYTTDYFSDVVANRTLQMIREFTADGSPADEPFLIVNSWPAPHDPIIPAPWAQGWFDGARAPRTPNWNASEESIQTKHWVVRKQSPITPKAELFIDRIHQSRLETLLSVDRHIDQFVRLLEEQGVLDNTIIMYTSDNGFQLGNHRIRHEKYQMYEHDIRVPFLVRGPNIPKNFSVYDIALNIDIAPTIYQVIQSGSTTSQSVPIPETMDGTSFLPIAVPGRNATSISQRRQDFLISYHGEGQKKCGANLCGLNPFIAQDAFNNTYHCVRSIVLSNNTDFIYCRFEDDENFVEYYDLTEDPFQLRNTAGELSQGRIAALDGRLTALRACSGSECRSPWRGVSSAIVVEPRSLTSSATCSTFWHLFLIPLALVWTLAKR